MRSLMLLMLMPLAASAQLTPTLITQLAAEVSETSGLLRVGDELWTHEDSGNEPNLYCIDRNTGAVLRTVQVNAPNIDWEDIASDGMYVYIGDIGNNSGARTDLRILRFPLDQLLDEDVLAVDVETIGYGYEDQVDFTPANNANNWDCEAMIARDDSIFLFTKNWVDQETRLYALPAVPGEQVARLRGAYDVQGMVTGAAVETTTGQVALIGYTNGLFVPFICTITGYAGNAFFSGDVVRETLSLSFVQTEAVEWEGPAQIIFSNEQGPLSQPRLWSLPLATEVRPIKDAKGAIPLHPNPASDVLRLDLSDPVTTISILDQVGRLVEHTQIRAGEGIDVSLYPAGPYQLLIGNDGRRSGRFMVAR